MISSAERVGNSAEVNTEQQKHPLEEMPSFEEHMKNIEASNREDNAEVIGGSDKTIERIFDRIGRETGEGYFNDPDKLANLTKDALSMTPQQSISNFKSQVEAYKARSTENYRLRAALFYEQTRDNVQRLARENMVGNDTIKVFLNPDYISEVGRGRTLSEYNAIQSDFSRREEDSWLTGPQTYQRYQMQAKMMADSFAENGGDVAYQKEVDEQDATYSPDGPFYSGQFIHVNSNKPREKGGLRCYISTDKTTDPGAVLYAWKESVQESPLKDSLYFKFATSMDNYRNGGKQRPDDIVIYKTDNIDDGQFKELLQDFQRRCNEMSPDLLPSDDRKMPAATQKIANGISISGEPGYVNDYLRYTDHKEGKHSWTTFVDKMAILSTSVAANRLGVRPDSLDVPGLEEETKKVFREFMLLSKINPDTMLPEEYGNSRPSWANLEGSARSDISEVVENKQEKADLAEKAPENPSVTENEVGKATEVSSETITNRRQIASGERSTIYTVEKVDGKTSTQVESDYFGITEKFTRAHDELNNNFDLKFAMSGLSTDLALIDATHGKNFEDGNEKQRSALLEEYSTLRSRLDDPNTSQEEKLLISEYFDQMNGEALNFLESRYTPEQAKPDNTEQGEKREKFNAALDEAKENLEKAKRLFLEDSGNFDKALSQINELVENRSMDIDALQTQLSNLVRANEDLYLSTGRFATQNVDYETTVYQGRELLNEEEYKFNQQQIDENENLALDASRKLDASNDRIAQIRKYISAVDEALAAFRRF